MHRRHALSVRVKRLLKHTGICFFQCFVIHAKRLRHMNQRALSGISKDFAPPVGIQACVVTKRRCINQLLINLWVLFGRLIHRCSLARLKIPIDCNLGHSHFVQRQRTCFIGTNYRRTAQRFHSGQLAD